MELDASLSWLALALTPGLACRLCARLLCKIGLPDRIFHAPLTELESCSLPARVAQAIHNKDTFKRAEKELGGIRNIPGCRLLNWTEPEYPQTLLQILGDCDRGGRVQRVLNNSAPRDGIWQRSFWGTGECHPGS